MSEIKDIYHAYFHKKLIIDIETVSCVSRFSELSDDLQAHWYNKATNLIKYSESEASEEKLFEERAGIYAEFGKIVCISVGRFVLMEDNTAIQLKIKSYSNKDEFALISSFLNDITTFEQNQLIPVFCGHNIREFDLPYICRRSLVHGLSLPKCLQLVGAKSWNYPHIDTLELWRFGDYKHYISLDLLACLLGVPSSKGEMDGSQVSNAYWVDDNLDGIVQYCNRDIKTTAMIYMKLNRVDIPLEIKIL